MIRHRSLVMIFSDLLGESDEIVKSLHHLRHRGNDVILFHILDAAEAQFPFKGMVEFQDNESELKMVIDSDGIRADYIDAVGEFREKYRSECSLSGVDYIPLHTGLPFDKALTEYLFDRQQRF